MGRRRRSSVQTFLEGFNSGYKTTKGVMSDWDARKISDAELETVTGEDGKESYKFLGKEYDTAPTEAEQKYARNTAMGESMKKYGDAKGGMQMEAMAGQQRTADEEAAFNETAKEWYAGSKQGQAQASHQKSMQEWGEKNKAYEEQIKQGANPQELGLPPAQPEAPTMTYLDRLNDTASYLGMKSSAGKHDPQAWLALGKEMESVKQSGAIEALKMLNAGDLDGAIAAFNKSGQMNFDRNDVVSFGPTTVDASGVPMKTYEMVIKQADGSTQRINAFSQLDGYGKAQEIYKRTMDGRADQRSGASLGLQYAKHSQSQAESNEKKQNEADKAAAGVNLFKSQNPNATPEELEAVKHGILKYAKDDKGDSYKPMGSDIRANFSKPAVDERGEPMYDPLTGRQLVNRDTDAEGGFEQWMADNNETDSEKAYVKYKKFLRENEKADDSRRKSNIPRNKEDALKAAVAAVKEGVPLEEVNKRLKEGGFPQLEKM